MSVDVTFTGQCNIANYQMVGENDNISNCVHYQLATKPANIRYREAVESVCAF
jgi:hypothetical protein